MAGQAYDPINFDGEEPAAIRTSKLKVNATGVFEVHWSEGGRSRRRSCNTKDALTARRWLKDWRDEVRAALTRSRGPRPLMIDALCARWLAHVEPQALSKARTGRSVLRAPRERLGVLTVDELTDGVALADYTDRRMAANGTIRRELGALRTVLNWAAKRRLIDAALIPNFELPPSGAPRERFLSQSEQARFWDAAVSYKGVRPQDHQTARWVRLFACLGLDTAARRGAIHALTWDRVNLEQRVIDYRVPGERKTNKRKAIVAISDRLLVVLRDAWDLAPKDAQGKAMGRVLGGIHVHQGFRTFVKSIGLPWVTPHVLRHTYASLAAMNGVGLWDIAQMMGDTVATIEKNYMHLAPGHLVRAANHYTQARTP